MLANGPQCTIAGAPSVVCTRFGISASLSSTIIGPTAFRSVDLESPYGVADGETSMRPRLFTAETTRRSSGHTTSAIRQSVPRSTHISRCAPHVPRSSRRLGRHVCSSSRGRHPSGPGIPDWFRPQASTPRPQLRPVATRSVGPGAWLRQPLPAWAQAAAACLIFASGLWLGVARSAPALESGTSQALRPDSGQAERLAVRLVVPSQPAVAISVSAADSAALERRLRGSKTEPNQ